MSPRTCITALAAFMLASTVNAHLLLETPIMYSKDVSSGDNGPINAQNYPCKTNFGFKVTKENNIAVGSKQSLTFKGTAVHGGGSCQLSVTLDRTPTANSVFKVIKSIEGGCPGVSGGANTYDFELPASVPNGEATFAWTWFPRLSGAPEMYMNCAPITVTGGASDKTAFNALPDMFVANIGSTTCKSPANSDVSFPNPGSVVQKGGDGKLAPPTGSCGKAGNGGGNNGGGNGGGSSSSSTAAAPVSSTAAATPATSSRVVPSNPGGIFVPSPSKPVEGAPSKTSVLTTLITRTASASSPAETQTETDAAPAPTTSAPAPTGVVPTAPGTGGIPQPTGTTPNPGTGGGNSACGTEGAIVCNGTTQFGLCNHGKVVWQPVAAGTTCQGNAIVKRNVRRSYHGRFVHGHRSHRY